MGKLKWHKRDHNAALSGMMVLTLEERGAYNTILDLIYTHDGSVVDDERFIAGWLRCDVRVWKRIRQRLLDLEKLYLIDGTLRNRRADAEVLRGLGRCLSAEHAGRTSALSKARKSSAAASENKDLASTDVEAPVQREFQRIYNQTLPSEEELSPCVPPQPESQPKAKAKRDARKTRIPDGFDLTPEMRAFAVEKMGGGAVDGVFAQFRDFHQSRGTLHVDWVAAWRFWVRNERPSRGPPPQRRGTLEGALDILNRSGFLDDDRQQAEPPPRRADAPGGFLPGYRFN